jgi:hypothetical protein
MLNGVKKTTFDIAQISTTKGIIFLVIISSTLHFFSQKNAMQIKHFFTLPKFRRFLPRPKIVHTSLPFVPHILQNDIHSSPFSQRNLHTQTNQHSSLTLLAQNIS